ncbi:MAG: helix-turn-helix domain-containing protein [Planctomycetia bacterium]|nr:helix-turn-helix domain-containing protein [Planctomycetia bacterium]
MTRREQVKINRALTLARRAARRAALVLPERVYNQTEAAEFLGVSTPTLRRWTNEGKIKARKAGRKIFYTESNLKTFLKGKE